MGKVRCCYWDLLFCFDFERLFVVVVVVVVVVVLIRFDFEVLHCWFTEFIFFLKRWNRTPTGIGWNRLMDRFMDTDQSQIGGLGLAVQSETALSDRRPGRTEDSAIGICFFFIVIIFWFLTSKSDAKPLRGKRKNVTEPPPS